MTCLVLESAYLLMVTPSLYFAIITNPYVWMLYAPGPLFVGMGLSLLLAVGVRWTYQCRIEGNKIVAKDTWGRELIVDPNEIASVRNYAVPFMPLSRVALRNNKWPAWIPTGAADNILKKS